MYNLMAITGRTAMASVPVDEAHPTRVKWLKPRAKFRQSSTTMILVKGGGRLGLVELGGQAFRESVWMPEV
jgi:hypothetical protein